MVTPDELGRGLELVELELVELEPFELSEFELFELSELEFESSGRPSSPESSLLSPLPLLGVLVGSGLVEVEVRIVEVEVIV